MIITATVTDTGTGNLHVAVSDAQWNVTTVEIDPCYAPNAHVAAVLGVSAALQRNASVVSAEIERNDATALITYVTLAL